jgi:hypothetical protein
MQTQLWRPNVGIAELGEDNLLHLGADGLEPITMVLVEIRRGRSLDQRRKLGRCIVDICGEVLGVPKRTVLVEFTFMAATRSCVTVNGPATGAAAKASAERPATFVQPTQGSWDKRLAEGGYRARRGRRRLPQLR